MNGWPLGPDGKCRICGLGYVPEEPEDVKLPAKKHRAILKGGLPLEVRNFLKAWGWAAAYGNSLQDTLYTASFRESELGKQAVVFAWWCRARANGLRDADFEPFMQAHFAFVDAKAEQNPDKIRTAAQSIRRWEKYAG
jgi:hypothetical protein